MIHSTLPKVAEQIALRASTFTLAPDQKPHDMGEFVAASAFAISEPIVQRILLRDGFMPKERERDIENGIDVMAAFVGRAALSFRMPAHDAPAVFQSAIQHEISLDTVRSLTRHRALAAHIIERTYGLRPEYFYQPPKSLAHIEQGSEQFFAFNAEDLGYYDHLSLDRKQLCPFEDFITETLPAISAGMLQNGLLEYAAADQHAVSGVQ